MRTNPEESTMKSDLSGACRSEAFKDSDLSAQACETHSPEPMVCPSCGFEQKPAEECRKCGIIIRKAREKQTKTEESDLTSSKQKENRAGFLLVCKKAIRYIWAKNKADLRSYTNTAIEAALRALVGLLVIGGLVTGLMYACKAVWFFYIATPVGKQYIISFEKEAKLISELLNENTTRLGMKSSLYAFLVSLAIGGLSHFLYISRYFYYSMGFFGKLVFWGLPLSTLVAYFLRSEFGLAQWGVAYTIALLPTLGLFSICFESAGDIVPEIGEVIRSIRHRRSELLDFEQKQGR